MAERTVQFWQVTDALGMPLGGRFPAADVADRVGKLTGANRYTNLATACE